MADLLAFVFVFDVSELGNRLSFNSNPLVFCASPGRQVPLFTRLACRRLQDTLQYFYPFFALACNSATYSTAREIPYNTCYLIKDAES